MRKTYCDRCGCDIDRAGGFDLRITEKDIVGEYKGRYDLCPVCWEDLKNWMTANEGEEECEVDI